MTGDIGPGRSPTLRWSAWPVLRSVWLRIPALSDDVAKSPDALSIGIRRTKLRYAASGLAFPVEVRQFDSALFKGWAGKERHRTGCGYHCGVESQCLDLLLKPEEGTRSLQSLRNTTHRKLTEAFCH
jgi:hypothetical protein